MAHWTTLDDACLKQILSIFPRIISKSSVASFSLSSSAALPLYFFSLNLFQRTLDFCAASNSGFRLCLSNLSLRFLFAGIEECAEKDGSIVGPLFFFPPSLFWGDLSRFFGILSCFSPSALRGPPRLLGLQTAVVHQMHLSGTVAASANIQRQLNTKSLFGHHYSLVVRGSTKKLHYTNCSRVSHIRHKQQEYNYMAR